MTTNTQKKAAGASNTNGLHTETNSANSPTGGAIDQPSSDSMMKRVGITSIERGVAAKAMSDALVSSRAAIGKVTKSIHFINEHSLCNWILTGHHGSIDYDSLDDCSRCRLDEIRTMNAALIAKGQTRDVRRVALREAFPLPQQGGNNVYA